MWTLEQELADGTPGSHEDQASTKRPFQPSLSTHRLLAAMTQDHRRHLDSFRVELGTR